MGDRYHNANNRHLHKGHHPPESVILIKAYTHTHKRAQPTHDGHKSSTFIQSEVLFFLTFPFFSFSFSAYSSPDNNDRKEGSHHGFWIP